ncbi:propane monooxygenase reductase subunit [Arboricoccus pini]|uniref:Propane monooxygenase reductase subunit n=1 Tax=Arboricoccus pini TaxID=1963835 RepID=A0A212RGA9_9PROT|nr:2Fe-2S iron-sulfur cluster binding domain-containing protein [Arboricoccus pini]SNB71387.1 propane monooxygenase reductase subunit [Arboricoccus pini]
MAEKALPLDVPVYTVRLEPVGIDLEVREGETVLNAAFRQGVALPHGCKEGQCSACKCILHDGDIELLKYSTFALSEIDRDTNHILLCRTIAYSDMQVELLNYDEELLSHAIPVRDYPGAIAEVEWLTHDIARFAVDLETPMKFFAGQYADITVPAFNIMRSYSMASTPDRPDRLDFIIKRYPGGAFSALLDDKLEVGTPMIVKGPYGGCFRREHRSAPMLLVGGGSGMSPLWSILNDQATSGEPGRPIRLFYGARSRRDLFWLDRFAELTERLPDFKFIPALSAAESTDDWHGATGFIHDVVREALVEFDDLSDADAYSCGPPPLIDAVVPVLQIAGVEPERMYFDKFTQAPLQ